VIEPVDHPALRCCLQNRLWASSSLVATGWIQADDLPTAFTPPNRAPGSGLKYLSDSRIQRIDIVLHFLLGVWMEPENQPPVSKPAPAMRAPDGQTGPYLSPRSPRDAEFRDPSRLFFGSQGLRAGWSVLIAAILYRTLTLILGTAAIEIYPALSDMDFSPTRAIIEEMIPFLAMLAAGLFVASIEHRRILDYNLTDPKRSLHFVSGLAAGFVALSALVGSLAWGGWLHFGSIALSLAGIFKFGALWAIAFLLVGCVEEGVFRCFLQSTLTRGINFWWALGIVGILCLDLLLRANGYVGIVAFIRFGSMPALKGNCEWGVYVVASLGLVPCMLLYLKKIESSGFWQAAWATSTSFGYLHTGNNGENWIGIFAASLIGFVFCVSVKVTGSAWWAIGCHSAWDWGETYFYGTADSGLVARGHLLTTTTAGNTLWTGGTDGPEGSVLMIGAVLLLLLILVVNGRRNSDRLPVRALGQATR